MSIPTSVKASAGVPVRFPACQPELERWVEARYLEMRLAHGQDRIDYLVAFPRAAAGPTARELSRLLEARPAAGRATWEAIGGLVREWGRAESPIGRHVPTLWFEFDDVRTLEPTQAVPSVSLCLATGYQWDRPLPARNAARDLEVVGEVLAVLGTGAGARALLAECWSPGVSGVRWIHFSVMTGREPAALKLYGVVPRAALRTALLRLGWAGGTWDVEALLHQLYELYPSDVLGDAVFIDLNLDNFRDGARCSLGLAVSQQHRLLPGADPGRRELLERWRQRGLAASSRLTHLAEWLGQTGPLDAAQAPMEESPTSGRFLDLKLVWQANCPLHAKAYLGWHGHGQAAGALAVHGAVAARSA